MKDSVIFEALKLALFKAFFVPTIVCSPDGSTTYVGGQISEVVKQIMESPKMKKLIEELAENVLEKKGDIEKRVFKELDRYVKEKAENLIKDDYSIDIWVKNVMSEVAKPAIEEALKKDQELKKKIARQVKLKNYNLDISVSVSITKKK